jgi:hypothetical protein
MRVLRAHAGTGPRAACPTLTAACSTPRLPVPEPLLTPPCPQLDPGLWEVCLQDYGIYRSSAICGSYLSV